MNKDKGKVIEFSERLPTVEIKLHPEEVLDLDEETIAIGKAKLAGVDFVEIYGDEDRSSPELKFRQQSQKIRELFRSPSELQAAFSSERGIREAHKDMIIDGVDLLFVKKYCLLNQIKCTDDAEALSFVGFGKIGRL